MGDFGYGQLTPTDTATDFGVISFICRQLINKLSTVMPVQIVSVTNQGGVSPVGSVDVQPLVSLLDGIGNASQHGVVHNIPYFRLQGGTNAIIIDPMVGDIGYVTCADHDISSVKSSKGQATPGSRRRFSLADSIYIGGILNGVPTQYIQFNDTGVTITDANDNQITMNAQGITMTAVNVIITGNLQLGGTVQGVGGGAYSGTFNAANFVAGSVDLTGHVHGGVTTGGGTTGPATG